MGPEWLSPVNQIYMKHRDIAGTAGNEFGTAPGLVMPVKR